MASRGRQPGPRRQAARSSLLRLRLALLRRDRAVSTASVVERGTPGATAPSARSPPDGSNIEPANYHKCLGYFSVRYLEAAGRWAMLYTCGNDDEHHRPRRTNDRGVFLRTAALPWGLWSPPARIFDPGTGYCQFMHLPDGPCALGTNPSEGEKRKNYKGVLVREPTGEYAPFLLLHVREARRGGTGDLYYLMSTWNPYQVR